MAFFFLSHFWFWKIVKSLVQKKKIIIKKRAATDNINGSPCAFWKWRCWFETFLLILLFIYQFFFFMFPKKKKKSFICFWRSSILLTWVWVNGSSSSHAHGLTAALAASRVPICCSFCCTGKSAVMRRAGESQREWLAPYGSPTHRSW